MAGGLLLAVTSGAVTSRLRVPAAFVFLISAAIASELFPRLGETLSIRNVERIGVVALIVILFDGGMRVGWRRFRTAIVPIGLLGVVGTFLCAGIVAVAVHATLDASWTTAAILAAALAPTDPAVMFSALSGREVAGRTGTILEGESGANDPVSIAMMLGVLSVADNSGSVADAAGTFVLQMVVGIVVGVLGAWAVDWEGRRLSLASQGDYPLRTLAAAGVIYGAATLAHGSGFLAVLVAGLLLGDRSFPHKQEILHFHATTAGLAEVVVFVALGATVNLGEVRDIGAWGDGLVVAAILLLVARPLSAGLLLLPVRLRPGERLFVMGWGMKGAVPILLGALAVVSGAEGAHRVYLIVFVVVAVTVLVQGTTLEAAARRLGVPMGAGP